jgi:hypothetical protein
LIRTALLVVVTLLLHACGSSDDRGSESDAADGFRKTLAFQPNLGFDPQIDQTDKVVIPLGGGYVAGVNLP